MGQAVTWCHLENSTEVVVGGSGARGCRQLVCRECFLEGDSAMPLRHASKDASLSEGFKGTAGD